MDEESTTHAAHQTQALSAVASTELLAMANDLLRQAETARMAGRSARFRATLVEEAGRILRNAATEIRREK